MNRLTQPVEQTVIDKLNPILQQLVRELGVKEVDYGEDFTEFVYNGHTIKITVTSKKV